MPPLVTYWDILPNFHDAFWLLWLAKVLVGLRSSSKKLFSKVGSNHRHVVSPFAVYKTFCDGWAFLKVKELNHRGSSKAARVELRRDPFKRTYTWNLLGPRPSAMRSHVAQPSRINIPIFPSTGSSFPKPDSALVADSDLTSRTWRIFLTWKLVDANGSSLDYLLR